MFLLVAQISFFLLLFSCGNAAKEWTGTSYSPYKMAPPLLHPGSIRNFDLLPQVGSVGSTQKFWSGDYWPDQKGGISQRWNSSKWLVEIPIYETAKTMAED